MEKLSREQLMSLEAYAEARPEFRRRAMEHKKDRAVEVGPRARFYFEDRLTVQYQVQEMLRAERIFEAREVEDELAAYNPLIPDGCNLKATFMLEYEDPEERRRELARLRGIEDRVWLEVEGCERVWAIADEDLERSTEDKTSSVHFVRFELGEEMARALKAGAALTLGIDHPEYRAHTRVAESVRVSLAADLD